MKSKSLLLLIVLLLPSFSLAADCSNAGVWTTATNGNYPEYTNCVVKGYTPEFDKKDTDSGQVFIPPVGGIMLDVQAGTFAGERAMAAAGAAQRGLVGVSSLARAGATLNTIAANSADAVVFEKMVAQLKAGSPLTEDVFGLLNKYNLVADGATKSVSFIDDGTRLIANADKIKPAFMARLAKASVALNVQRAAELTTRLDTVVGLTDDIQKLHSAGNTTRVVAKSKELFSHLDVLAKAGDITQDTGNVVNVVKSGSNYTLKVTNSAGNVLKTSDFVADVGGALSKLSCSGASLNVLKQTTALAAAAKVPWYKTAWVGTKSTVGKVAKVGGIFVGIPKAIVTNGAYIGLAASMPEPSPPRISIEQTAAGLKYFINLNFALNYERFESMRDDFEEGIDSSYGGVGNVLWETASFFDPTELGWAAYDGYEWITSSKKKNLVKGCDLYLVTPNSASTVVLENKPCYISFEGNESTYVNLPKGKYIAQVYLKISEDFLETFLESDGFSSTGFPPVMRGALSRNQFSTVKNYVMTYGIPSVSKIIEVDTGISAADPSKVYLIFNVTNLPSDISLSVLRAGLKVYDSESGSLLADSSNIVIDSSNRTLYIAGLKDKSNAKFVIEVPSYKTIEQTLNFSTVDFVNGSKLR